MRSANICSAAGVFLFASVAEVRAILFVCSFNWSSPTEKCGSSMYRENMLANAGAV